MSFYRRHVVPRLVHLAMRQKPLLPFRRRVIGAAQGRVLEIGIGSGLNLPLYGPAVRSVIGLEPSPELLRMARRRCGISVPVEFLDASAEAIPLDDKSVDAAVTTWTLCTIPDVRCALAEMRRVLNPVGALLLLLARKFDLDSDDLDHVPPQDCEMRFAHRLHGNALHSCWSGDV